MQEALSRGSILNISSNADVYERGEKYYRDGKLLSIRTQELDGGLTQIKAQVEGNYKNYEVSVTLESSGAVKTYTCSCESHNIWRGACKHVVTALFAVSEGRCSTQSSEKLSQTARGLTDALEKIIFEDIDASLSVSRQAPANPIRLAPCFHSGAKGEAFLTFTVGYNRPYLIKNVSSFLTSVRKEETVSYGSGLQFNHAAYMFDDESRKLLEFMLREDALFMEVTKKLGKQYQYMAQTARSNTRALTVTERNMDDFFALYEGREIEGDVSGETQLRLTGETPDVRLHVKHEPKTLRIAAEEFNYRVTHGQKYHYFISHEAIHRMPRNDAKVLIHLLRAFSASQNSELLFTGNEQSRFLTIILPKLQKLGLIRSTEGEPPVSVADELKVQLYFDSAGKEVTGRAVFRYGETEINPLEDTVAGVLRDAAGEYAIKRRLTVYGFNPDPARKEYVLAGNDLMYAFLHGTGGEPSGLDVLMENAEVYMTDALSQKKMKLNPPSLGLRLQGGLLDIKIENSGYTLNELMEALDSYRAKKKYYRLKDGRFLPLECEEIKTVANILTALDVSRKDIRNNVLVVPAYRALYVDELTAGLQASRSVTRNHDYQAMVNQFKSDDARIFEIPETLENVLREYQKTGYQWLKTLSRYGFGGILADDMGLGKTIQIIAILLSEKREGVRSLVVAPTSLLYNWEHEIRRFAPGLNTAVVTGLPDKRREILEYTEADVYITTYDTMKRDVEAYAKMDFAYVIADEAQNIKNPNTQNARAIKSLNARVKFALTGTPIENTLTELWSIFDFILPGYLYSAHKFNRLFEYPIVKDNDKSRMEKLKRQIAPFILRRVKKNVLTELPDKTETTLLAELLPEQKKIYLAHLKIAKGEFDAAAAGGNLDDNRMRILAQLTRLRQICCHPSMFAEKYNGGSGKLDLALETIQMAVESGHRVLLFSQFTSMLEILQRALERTPFRYFYLDGTVKAQNRIDMTTRFNAGERDIFLISLKAGGTGLNLIGADVVLHYDPWWNPSVMDQASDRAHRYGQEKAVQIFNLVAKDTIEEKIMDLQEKKRNLIDSVITEGGSFVNTLSEEELRELFK
ncbi:MAG: SNF2 helicase associated domain-containing protein [Clostridiales bacterium]|jgi:superfamily II DNA or RNA helicase|nr:SNF2 helicase associated domain-containing protein [Clostridiales bacterium]